MLAAVEFTLSHRGPHGLPRSGFSDWNDTLNVDHGSGKAESVWTGMQFCRALLDLADLCRHSGRGTQAERFEKLHAEMARGTRAPSMTMACRSASRALRTMPST